MSEAIDAPTIFNSALLLIGAVVPTALIAWGLFRKKLSAFREFIVELDDDLQDNHLSNEEYGRLVHKFKAMLT